MAGLGYKNFNTGDVLTAGDVDNYLMEQTVMVFASAAARTSALTSVLAEGMISYLKDTNSTEYYSGSAWTAIGDGAGGFTTLGTGTLSGSSVTVSSIPGTYVNLQLDVYNMTSSADSGFLVTVNGLSSNYAQSLYYHASGSSGNSGTGSSSQWDFTPASTFEAASDANHLQMTIYNYAATNRVALASSTINYLYGGGTTKFSATGSHANTGINAAITSVTVASQVGTFSGGTYILRGIK